MNKVVSTHLMVPESLCYGVPGEGQSTPHPPPQSRISYRPQKLYKRIPPTGSLL